MCLLEYLFENLRIHIRRSGRVVSAVATVVLLLTVGYPCDVYGQKRTVSRLTPSSFSTEGLNLETELKAIYLGDFANARLERSDHIFLSALGSYLYAFGNRCKAYLPKNRVQMTKPVCVREQYQVNGWGVKVGPSTCVEYERRGTGVYADRALYSVHQRLDAEAAQNMVRDTFGALLGRGGGNPMGGAVGVIDAANTVGNDMTRLLQINSCSSAGLKRFQENMRRFGDGLAPLRLPGNPTLTSASPKPTSAKVTGSANYTKLVDDLIAENSRGWMMNRYSRGSATNVRVTSRDSSGRPAMITSDYVFSGFNGRSRGSVRIEFRKGLPHCMYFFDYPNTCRSPSRRIVTAFENGSY